MAFEKKLQKDLDILRELVFDDTYLDSITPELDNNVSKTDMEKWRKEVEYSIKNYNVTKYLKRDDDKLQKAIRNIKITLLIQKEKGNPNAEFLLKRLRRN